MADKLVVPCTSVGLLVNFCLKASDRLCAGSVEIISTFGRTAASWRARLQEHVVLPAELSDSQAHTPSK